MGEAKAKKAETKKENNENNLTQKKNSKATNKDTKKEINKKDTKKDGAKEVTRKAPVVKKENAGPLWPRVKRFFKGAVNELKKVHWPSKQQLVAFTLVVIVSVLFMAALIWVVDSGLTQLIKLVLKK